MLTNGELPNYIKDDTSTGHTQPSTITYPYLPYPQLYPTPQYTKLILHDVIGDDIKIGH